MTGARFESLLLGKDDTRSKSRPFLSFVEQRIDLKLRPRRDGYSQTV